MHDVLAGISAQGCVLDIGCREGSFDASQYPFLTIRVDLERARGVTIVSDAALLPFKTGSFDAVISNHSLEHFVNLDEALAEIGRVLRPSGAVFVAVPDATTFTDRLYRWLARGGGHVNGFTRASELASRIEDATHLRHTGTRLLHTSLSFLNRRNRHGRAPRKLILLCGGREWFLVALTYLLRTADRVFRSRLSVYGWALYFGGVPQSTAAWTNVCVRCGAGHPARILPVQACRLYRCPNCGARNLFTADAA